MDYSAWIGRSETSTDVADGRIYQRLAALLDHEAPPWRSREAPPLGHWLNFLPDARQDELGEDGHPRRGGFLPPVALPRRMWAGSRLSFPTAIPLDAPIERRSTIRSIQPKSGRSGEMVFVTVRHEIFANGAIAVTDEHDIVYRGAPDRAAAPPAQMALQEPTQAQWTRRVTPDPVLLFRYSALTYNGHRIHYDRTFCQEVEGYPGLVVHGPLIATLLLNHYLRRHPAAPVARFSFRARKPIFDTGPFDLNGRVREGGTDLWASINGEVAMTASVELGPI